MMKILISLQELHLSEQFRLIYSIYQTQGKFDEETEKTGTT